LDFEELTGLKFFSWIKPLVSGSHWWYQEQVMVFPLFIAFKFGKTIDTILIDFRNYRNISIFREYFFI